MSEPQDRASILNKAQRETPPVCEFLGRRLRCGRQRADETL